MYTEWKAIPGTQDIFDGSLGHYASKLCQSQKSDAYMRVLEQSEP